MAIAAITLTYRSKDNCGASPQYNSSGSVDAAPQITVSSLDAPKPKGSRKKAAAAKTAEKPVLCEFDSGAINRGGVESRQATEQSNSKHKYFLSQTDPFNIKGQVQTSNYASYQRFRLNLEALQIKQTRKIDRLIALDAIRTKLTPYNFQMKTALQVSSEMNANAILADEVGLGKTIEAGLIIKELLLREEINSILIVSPKSLLYQWKSEMAEKFGEAFAIANNPQERVDFECDDRIICSHNLLARKFEKIAGRTWDLVVVDEAHAFRNTHSKGRACLGNLRKNHLLLLTATPLCNRLSDLYSIVDLIQPGILGSERAFISRFAEDSRCRVVRQDEAAYLRQILRDVMCRTRREQTGIPFTKRIVESRTLEANLEEREFIDEATQYLRDVSQNRFKTIEALIAENPSRKFTASQSNAILVFQAITLQQSFSSSPDASIESLTRRQQRFPMEKDATDKLLEMAKKVRSAKMELLRSVLRDAPKEQALIFCLRKVTARKIKELLDAEFGRAAVYLGDMNQAERETVIEQFKSGEVRYLVATDAAAEGLNLQNCAVMFNYDLHWNPMKIEQRIGRIHRFKQDRDVTVFNLCVKDTIDDYVLHILYQKIDLFTMTVGKMETVLAELKEGSQDIQKTIGEILLRSSSRLDIKKELEKLAADLNVSRETEELAEKFTEGVID
ncbi:MAG: DEAD/DEAH box helicase [Candidatus Bathyarchaeota archaeon]|nr:DEAD/DEAH box helicase [Candidatus Bathyarchaeota archaeon]